MMESIQVPSEEDRLRLIINPYSNRGPVTNPTQFYGRRNDILNIAKSIMLSQPFAVSGEPRIGKTSLLYYLAHPQGARKLAAFRNCIGNPSNYLFVLIELQRLPIRNAVGFWRYLLDRLNEEASKEDHTIGTAQKANTITQESGIDQYQVQTRFESYLKQLEKKVVFLFDDFDILISDFDNTEVVQVTDKLRTLKETLDLNEKLNYVIMSTDPLVRLLKAKRIVSVSPFISNIIPIPPLGFLDEDAANALILEPLRQPREQASLQFTAPDVNFIYQLAGRHPDFMKITCYYLFSAYIQENPDFPTVYQKIDQDAHLTWLMNGLWERVKKDEQLEELPLSEVLLQIAQGQEPANSSAFRELRERGLVEISHSSACVFGDLFRNFILHFVPTAVPPSSFELTNLESKLYNYLAEHIGQPCSRAQLQTAIWGDKLPNSPDALEQLVKRVRAKIEPHRDQPTYLISVRGQGYLLRSEPTRLV